MSLERTAPVAIMSVTLVGVSACRKEATADRPPAPTTAAPVVITAAATAITGTTASAGGNVISGGGAAVTARGACWGTAATPTIDDDATSDATGVGGSASTLTGLAPNIQYHVRAYATSGAGTGYGRDAVDGATNGNTSICPEGWHIPTETKWTILTTYPGGIDVAGGKMKEAGTSHRLAPNTAATNESTPSGLPGGYRGYTNGACDTVGLFWHWWSGAQSGASQAWGEGLVALEAQANHSPSVKKSGSSLRCIRN